MTRSHLKWTRVYAGGYPLSAYTLDLGPLATEFEAEPQAALTDAVRNVAAPGGATLSPGTLNGVFDPATDGLHALHNAPGASHVLTVAIGAGGEPVAGDPVFAGQWLQTTYLAGAAGGPLVATVDWGAWASDAATRAYGRGWGVLLHPDGAQTAPNGGLAAHDNGAATSGGGYAVLHALSGDGQASVSVQHSDTNTDAAFDATGAIISFSTTDFTGPASEIAATATPSTQIKRYTRWQVAFTTASTLTFVLSLVRG